MFICAEGKLDTAEIKLLQLLRLEQSAGIRKLHYTYDLLATTSMYQGNYNKALPYALETIRHMQATGDSASASIFYNRIGSIYRELDQYKNSIPGTVKRWTICSLARWEDMRLPATMAAP